LEPRKFSFGSKRVSLYAVVFSAAQGSVFQLVTVDHQAVDAKPPLSLCVFICVSQLINAG
jgi:hypothetical protein